MRNLILFVIIIISLTIFPSGQTIIENPEKPPAENAGRILQLQELMRITDIDREFYFKHPSILHLDQEGSIYLADEKLFLKFSPEGKLLKSFYHQGQGPGEIAGYFTILIQGEDVYAWDTGSRKMIIFSKDGDLIREFKINYLGGISLKGAFHNLFVFIAFGLPDQDKAKGKTININHDILLVTKDKGEERNRISLPIPWFFGQRFGIAQAPINVLVGREGKSLYINDTPEYQIRVLDAATGEENLTFRRKYRRIKAPKQSAPPDFPQREYDFDIESMIWNQSHIWVRTSTKNDEKCKLYDVFSPKGQYLDSFFIPGQITILNVYDGILFARRQDEEGQFSVVKYKILNGPDLPL